MIFSPPLIGFLAEDGLIVIEQEKNVYISAGMSQFALPIGLLPVFFIPPPLCLANTEVPN